MPKDVSYIIDTLGKVPADWDVATDAQPEDVKL